jgi:hypothetical protein
MVVQAARTKGRTSVALRALNLLFVCVYWPLLQHWAQKCLKVKEEHFYRFAGLPWTDILFVGFAGT